MLRFRINELMGAWNEGRPEAERITMEDVARAVGADRSTLAGLTRFGRRPAVTNTAYLESLCRFFRLQDWGDLLEFHPPIAETVDVHVDALYPERAIRRRIARDDAAQG